MSYRPKTAVLTSATLFTACRTRTAISVLFFRFYLCLAVVCLLFSIKSIIQCGSIPGWATIKLPRSTQPSILPAYVNRVPAWLAGVMAGCIHLCQAAGNTV